MHVPSTAVGSGSHHQQVTDECCPFAPPPSPGHVEHVDVQGCSFMQGPGADPVADFDPSSPNGHYCLDLTQPMDYQVCVWGGGYIGRARRHHLCRLAGRQHML
jgi:hypothetical protein